MGAPSPRLQLRAAGCVEARGTEWRMKPWGSQGLTPGRLGAGCWAPAGNSLGTSQLYQGRSPGTSKAGGGSGNQGRSLWSPPAPSSIAPRCSHRPAPGSRAGTPGSGAVPPPLSHGMAPSPSLWQPPPALGVFSAPGPPWEPGREPPHSARALWAAFVAGIEPSWQPLPPQTPPAPQGSWPRLAGGAVGEDFSRTPSTGPCAPLRGPRGFGPAPAKPSASGRRGCPERGLCPQPPGSPSPCQSTWDPRATCRPHCPSPDPPATSRGGGALQHSAAAGSGMPVSHPRSPQLKSGFPHLCLSFPKREPAPGQGFAALASTALRGCWPGSCMTSTVVLATTPALRNTRRHSLLRLDFGG